MNKICIRHQLPVNIFNFGSLWKIKFKQEYKHNELLFTLMRLKGIHILDNFPCFLSEAHQPDEVNQIAAVFEEGILAMAAAGFLGFTETQKAMPKIMPIKEAPPVLGARLGKDKEGNLAWFVPDPEHNGKFMQVKQEQLI